MIDVYCNETIVLIRPLDPGDWLEPGGTIEEEVDAYVDWTNELVRNIEGELVESAVKFLMEYDGTLNYDVKVRIQGRPHLIIKIGRRQDFSPVMLKVWCS